MVWLVNCWWYELNIIKVIDGMLFFFIFLIFCIKFEIFDCVLYKIILLKFLVFIFIFSVFVEISIWSLLFDFFSLLIMKFFLMFLVFEWYKLIWWI